MNAPELVRNLTNEGIYCALVVRGGRKWLRVVILDSSMRVRKVRLTEKPGNGGLMGRAPTIVFSGQQR